MPDLNGVTRFLLERRLIEPGAVVDGDLTVTSVARRNCNFLVRSAGGSGYLIKQPGDPAAGGAETVRREAEFLDFCFREPAAAEAVRFLPRLVCYDDAAVVLVQELVADSVPLWSFYQALEKAALDGVAGALGTALGTVHRVFRRLGPADADGLSRLPSGEPWALWFHEPRPGLLTELGPANAEVLRIVQSEAGLAGRLDHARRLWRRETLIHGDVKADNVLVRPPGATRAAAWLVDWELVQVGDPAWDLAGALQETVLVWLRSMPTTEPSEVESMVASARVPLGFLWCGTRALWHTYQEAARCGGDEADSLLTRAVTYSAARLIHSTYEELYGKEQLTARAVLCLQLAANILADPRHARTQLYGLPLGPYAR
jgi:hypothetical protein